MRYGIPSQSLAQFKKASGRGLSKLFADNQASNLLFVDQPTGTGFSYTSDKRNIRHNEEGISDDSYDFVHVITKRIAAAVLLVHVPLTLFVYILLSHQTKKTWSGFSIQTFSGLWAFLKLSTYSAVMLCLEVCVRVSNELGVGHPKSAAYSVVMVMLSSFVISSIRAIILLALPHVISYAFTDGEVVPNAV
ncbi:DETOXIFICATION 40-like protein [Tanacetum coccineum]